MNIPRTQVRPNWPIGYLASLLVAVQLVAVPPSANATDQDREQTIIFFGDSLTAGYGLENPDDAFPGLIAGKIEAAGLPFRVVNAGLSGETTAGGIRRADWILRQPCDVFVLELGGNDGLRGAEPSGIELNLIAILEKVRARNPDAALVVAGMDIFPSMGQDYRQAYQAVFPSVAERTGATLIPLLMDGVGGIPELNLADGIHPTASGHAIVAETIWRVLRPVLERRAAARVASNAKETGATSDSAP